MGDILGIGMTHYPAGLAPDHCRGWPLARYLRSGTVIREDRRDPATWPEPMRREWGNDMGESAHAGHRKIMFDAFRRIREELDAFDPDFVLIWADDQYENFKETIIPPFCVLAYDEIEYQPFVRMGRRKFENIWGLPDDTSFHVPGRHMDGRALTRGLLARGFDMPYAYAPMHPEGLGHGFANTLLYLDLDQKGFDYPVLPVAVNCYGSSVIREQGSGDAKDGKRRYPDAPDPPAPMPSRCFDLGAAIVDVILENDWRVALIGSSSWSHAFLTPKNDLLYPDREADGKLLAALEAGDYGIWRDMSIEEIEDAGQHEVLNWHCLIGAMDRLGAKMELLGWADTWCFNSSKCMAVFR
jgi:hypothetical protein